MPASSTKNGFSETQSPRGMKWRSKVVRISQEMYIFTFSLRRHVRTYTKTTTTCYQPVHLTYQLLSGRRPEGHATRRVRVGRRKSCFYFCARRTVAHIFCAYDPILFCIMHTYCAQTGSYFIARTHVIILIAHLYITRLSQRLVKHSTVNTPFTLNRIELVYTFLIVTRFRLG